MPRERLYLFDTTLRDGAQTNGVDFTLADKLAIARMLDDLGVDYVEAGYPGANPTDTNLFAERRKLRAQAHRLRHDAAARPLGLQRSGPGRRCSMPRPTPSASSPSRGIITCAWRSRRPKRKTSPRSATACAPPKPRAAKCCSTASIFSTATRPSPAYALACAKAAYDEGARWVVLCDTNGGTLPHEVEKIVGEVCANNSRRPCRHPRPQRHRAGGRQYVRRGARRRAPNPGHAQRARRALRQRQSHLHHPDAEAQAGVFAKNSTSACRMKSCTASPTSRTRSTKSSIARRTATRPMSARAHSPPRPAFMPRRS